MEDTAVGGFGEAAVRGVTFDASTDSVARARRLVASQLDAWSLSELSDDARLVASELLTNAALHAQPPIRMRLSRLASGIRLEVSDGSRDMPLMVRAGTDVMTGRGWTLVEALCHDWGDHSHLRRQARVGHPARGRHRRVRHVHRGSQRPNRLPTCRGIRHR